MKDKDEDVLSKHKVALSATIQLGSKIKLQALADKWGGSVSGAIDRIMREYPDPEKAR